MDYFCMLFRKKIEIRYSAYVYLRSVPFLISVNFHFQDFKMSLPDWHRETKQETFGYAAANGDLETVKRLAADPDVHPDGNFGEPLRWASSNGYRAIVDFLLQDPRVYPSSPSILNVAITSGHTDVVSLLLLDPRIDPTWDQNHALWTAVYNGHIEIVRLLLADPRINPTVQSPTRIPILSEAVELGQDQIVDILLRDGRVDPSEMENMALRSAIVLHRRACVSLLLYDPRVDHATGGMHHDINEPIELSTTFGDLATIATLITKPRVYMSPMSMNVKDITPYAMHYVVERAWFRRRHAVLGRAQRWL
jgi:hypothetical protein